MPKRSREDIKVEEKEGSEDESYVQSFYKEVYGEDSNTCDSSDSDRDKSTISVKVEPLRSMETMESTLCDSDLEYTEESTDESTDESMDVDVKEFILWHDVTADDEPLPNIPFSTATKNVGSQVPMHCTEPIDFFKLFFTNALVAKIVEQTNEYAVNKINEKNLSKRSIWNNWVDVTMEEMTAFVGTVLNMGTLVAPNMKEYWSRENTARIPFFSQIFRRERFQQIFWMLHLQINLSEERGQAQQIGTYLDYIDTKFREYFVPGREIVIYESIVKFKKRNSFFSYNPKRLAKWGIRIYVLADSHTGYVHSILPYYGRVSKESFIRPELDMKTRIVLHLYQKLLDSNPNAEGYHIFTDRYYTSLRLAQELLKLKCYITGTMKINRKSIPEIIREPKFLDNNVVACRSGNILLLAWKSRQITTLLSSWDAAGVQTVNKKLRSGIITRINKPTVAINFNKYTAGKDKVDQYGSTYCFMRKSYDRRRRLFFWGLEMCLINSYILYKESTKSQNKTTMSHLKFVRRLVDQLVGDFRDGAAISRGKPSTSDREERLNGKLHIIRRNEGGRSKDCLVCSNRRVKGGRRESGYHCGTCVRKPGLHIGDCFERYHTIDNYKKR